MVSHGFQVLMPGSRTVSNGQQILDSKKRVLTHRRICQQCQARRGWIVEAESPYQTLVKPKQTLKRPPVKTLSLVCLEPPFQAALRPALAEGLGFRCSRPSGMRETRKRRRTCADFGSSGRDTKKDHPKKRRTLDEHRHLLPRVQRNSL